MGIIDTTRQSNIVVIVLLGAGLVVFVSNPAVAFVAGALYSLIYNRPLPANLGKTGTYCLQIAIVLLGLKLNAGEVIKLTQDYAPIVAGYVVLAMVLGLLIGKLVQNTSKSSQLVSAGTAICGGTAVATISPVIQAKTEETGVALSLIFLLNIFALLLFPYIGQYLQMTQEQFGVWVALSVHDTSSVVATSAIFGEEAMKVATTVKLGRTLWLIPLILLFSVAQKRKGTQIRFPIFILLFILSASASSFIEIPNQILLLATKCTTYFLMVALFFMGLGLTRNTLQNLKRGPVIHILLLWLLVVPATLLLVVMNII